MLGGADDLFALAGRQAHEAGRNAGHRPDNATLAGESGPLVSTRNQIAWSQVLDLHTSDLRAGHETLVGNDAIEPVAVLHLQAPLAAQCLDRSHSQVAVQFVPVPLNDTDRQVWVGVSQLGHGLPNEFIPVDQDQRSMATTSQECAKDREDDRLAGAGRQHHGRSLNIVGPGAKDL